MWWTHLSRVPLIRHQILRHFPLWRFWYSSTPAAADLLCPPLFKIFFWYLKLPPPAEEASTMCLQSQWDSAFGKMKHLKFIWSCFPFCIWIFCMQGRYLFSKGQCQLRVRDGLKFLAGSVNSGLRMWSCITSVKQKHLLQTAENFFKY